jgi:hypothetical protein
MSVFDFGEQAPSRNFNLAGIGVKPKFPSSNHEAWCRAFQSFSKTKTSKLQISYRTYLPYYLLFSSRKIVFFLTPEDKVM